MVQLSLTDKKSNIQSETQRMRSQPFKWCVRVCMHACVLGVERFKPREAAYVTRLLRQRSALAYLTTQNTYMTEAWRTIRKMAEMGLKK